MASGGLSLFSYEILGLVGRTGASPHDLLRLAHRDRMFAWAGESQYYLEPKRLAKLGYLDASKEPGDTRERTVYTLTDRGRQALEEWARTPARFTPLKSEPLLGASTSSSPPASCAGSLSCTSSWSTSRARARRDEPGAVGARSARVRICPQRAGSFWLSA